MSIRLWFLVKNKEKMLVSLYKVSKNVNDSLFEKEIVDK